MIINSFLIIFSLFTTQDMIATVQHWTLKRRKTRIETEADNRTEAVADGPDLTIIGIGNKKNNMLVFKVPKMRKFSLVQNSIVLSSWTNSSHYIIYNVGRFRSGGRGDAPRRGMGPGGPRGGPGGPQGPGDRNRTGDRDNRYNRYTYVI